jgi:segregation and condensation protein A
MELTETGRQGSHSFRIKDFEGPLDLLLYLIRKNEVNIYDIPIAGITEQYLDYLRNAETIDLDDVTEFHAMAAMLLLLKSRTLLPVEMEDDGDMPDIRQELVEQLIEYQRLKKLSDLMEEKEDGAEWALERRKLQHNLPFSDEELWEKIDIWNLLKSFSVLVRNVGREQVINLFEEITVNEKTALLLELLEKNGECRLSDLIVRTQSVMDIVCAFLAVLEAVKIKMIVILQHRMFGDIVIRLNRAAA